ncbi:MAG: sialidase family protein [Thermoanaerobaculia bacterium]
MSRTRPAAVFALSLLIWLGCSRPTEERVPDEEARGGERHGVAGYRSPALPARLPRPAGGGWEAERLWSRAVDWEPVVAADPFTADVYQATTRYGAPECATCPDPTIVVRHSADGGVTWSEDRYPSRRGRALADPQLAVAGDGTLFAAYLKDFVPGVVLVTSRDHGRTWTEPVRAIGEGPPRWSDKPILVVSPDGRDVYLAFNAADSYVASSHDGGATFAAAVRTNDDDRYWFHSAGAVGPDGTVWFAAADYSRTYAGDSHVSVLRSVDGGESWTTQRVDTAAEAPRCRWWAAGCYRGFLGPQAAIAADSVGRLVLAYNAGTRDGGPPDLWVRTSDDGEQWSARRRVSGGGPMVQHAFAALAAGPLPGDFRLVWQDDRRTRRPRATNPDRRWNSWYRRSRDGGGRWGRRTRLSRGGGDPAAGSGYNDGRGFRFPYGDYLGLAVDANGRNHVIWGAGESYNGNGGTWYTRGR